ncbi:hypothetical protein BH11MYX1_BH11MYX1_28060 [soil metagenome]
MIASRRLPDAFCALAVAIGAAACGGRAQPYRFSSPLLGAVDVPPAWSGRPDDPSEHWRRPPADRTITVQNGIHRSPRTPEEDPRPGSIRVASAQAATEVTATAEANGVAWSKLPAAHEAALDAPHTALHEPSDLRALVGRRDQHDAVTAALGWESELGMPVSLDLASPAPSKSPRNRATAVIDAALANTGTLVAWAVAHERLAAPIAAIGAGDLLVFERTESDEAPDLVGLAIGRDTRGVTEFVYCAGGAIRRGFVDPRHPAQHRESSGAVVNTFLRTGNRWPPKGTHYLAGELLVHVVHVH